MAENTYPQIPSTVWWGVRQLLQKTPRAKLDENMLSAAISVQKVAAKQYIVELKRVGLIDDEGRATELANLWRMDESYASAVERIASECYPEGLVTIAPPGDADRQRVVNWFMTQGLGEGSAKNKASTYVLVTSLVPNAAPSSQGKSEGNRSSSQPPTRRPTGESSTGSDAATARRSAPPKRNGGQKDAQFPLNVNVQIHISADASSDQIEAIFSSMRKYLRDD